MPRLAGAQRPEIVLISDDLPAPLSPIRAVTLPGQDVEIDPGQRPDRAETSWSGHGATAGTPPSPFAPDVAWELSEMLIAVLASRSEPCPPILMGGHGITLLSRRV